MVFVSVLAFFMASTSLAFVAPYSVALRALGILLIVFAGIWKPQSGSASLFRKSELGFFFVGVGFSTFLLGSEVLHGHLLSLCLGLLSYFAVLIVFYNLLNRFSTRGIQRSVFSALLTLCVASLVAGLLYEEVAVENSRLRGLLENSNELGFLAFSLIAVSLALRGSPVSTFIGVAFGGLCIILSASRSSLLAALIFVLLLAFSGFAKARILLVVSAFIALLAWLALGAEGGSGLPIFRTNDSRSVGLQVASAALEHSFWSGFGELPIDIGVAGSVFAAAITGGSLGLIGLFIVYSGLLSGFSRFGPLSRSFIVAAIIHSFFESWVLSFSSPMLLGFFVVLSSLVKIDNGGKSAGGSLSEVRTSPPLVGVEEVGRPPHTG